MLTNKVIKQGRHFVLTPNTGAVGYIVCQR